MCASDKVITPICVDNFSYDGLMSLFDTIEELNDKTDGRTYKHYVQYYHEDEEITPEQAHKNAVELAEHTKAWKGCSLSIANKQFHISLYVLVRYRMKQKPLYSLPYSCMLP